MYSKIHCRNLNWPAGLDIYSILGTQTILGKILNLARLHNIMETFYIYNYTFTDSKDTAFTMS